MKRFSLLFGLMVALAMLFSACAASCHADSHAYCNAFDGNGYTDCRINCHFCAANIYSLCRRLPSWLFQRDREKLRSLQIQA